MGPVLAQDLLMRGGGIIVFAVAALALYRRGERQSGALLFASAFLQFSALALMYMSFLAGGALVVAGHLQTLWLGLSVHTFFDAAAGFLGYGAALGAAMSVGRPGVGETLFEDDA